MSLERVLRALESFGIKRCDAEVYVYLAKIGPSKAKDLSSGLRMAKQQLYPALKSLKKRGIVASSSDRPAMFSALAFEELLNLYMKLNTEKVEVIKETKEELVASWRKMTEQNTRQYKTNNNSMLIPSLTQIVEPDWAYLSSK